MSTKNLDNLIVGNDGLSLSDFISPKDESLNTQDDAQVADPILSRIVQNEVEVCQSLQWNFYHTSFELHGLGPQRVYVYNDLPCVFYMENFDKTNLDSYGTC